MQFPLLLLIEGDTSTLASQLSWLGGEGGVWEVWEVWGENNFFFSLLTRHSSFGGVLE